MPARVVVLGSANVDVVVPVDHRPRAGETVVGGDAVRHPGGKGANQAAAAGRAGAPCTFLGAVGRDADGDVLLAALADAGVDTDSVVRVERPTGTALITVTADGENAIVVAPGANAAVTPAMVDEWRPIWSDAAVLVISLELAAETVGHAVEVAAAAGVRVLVNAAPAAPWARGLVGAADPLIANEHEAVMLLGHATGPTRLVSDLRATGARSVVVTLGANGARLDGGTGPVTVPAHRVEAVDTTGAGDAFVGAVAAGLARGETLVDAARFAAAMAALATTRPGAQPSYPDRAAVERWLTDGLSFASR